MFPVPLEAMQAQISYEDFRAGESLDLYPDITVRTAPLNHPNDATAYRIDYNGHSAVYVTDTEHVPGKLDQNILDIIEGADLVITHVPRCCPTSRAKSKLTAVLAGWVPIKESSGSFGKRAARGLRLIILPDFSCQL